METTNGSASPHVIEPRQRMSRSVLWELQRRFYGGEGIDAWRKHYVPHFVTNNALTAQAYAAIVAAFLRDCQEVPAGHPGYPPLDPEQPIHLLELGAGSGRFAWLFLRRLQELLRRQPQRGLRFRYVMTDFTERNLDFWQSHPQFQSLIEAGLLDFARFDMEDSAPITLRRSGEILTPGALRNPLVVLANYYFDSIPFDVFSIEQGELHEALVTLSTADEPGADMAADPATLLSELQLRYEMAPAHTDYYGDPELDGILRGYKERLTRGVVPFPCAALRCCQRLRELSSDRMLLLCGDKGFLSEAAIADLDLPGIAVHGGGFSVDVNFHAIAEYFRNHGGQVLAPRHRHKNLLVVGFLLGAPPSGYGATNEVFTDTLVRCGPDDFMELKAAILTQAQAQAYRGTLTLQQILALLRLGGGDPELLRQCLPALLQQVQEAAPERQQEVAAAIQEAWALYYHIGHSGPSGADQDLPFGLGQILHAMNFSAEALTMFERSRALYGPHPATLLNIAVCKWNLHDCDAALELLREVLMLHPEHAAAQALQQDFQAMLSER